jgi:hypothetical protein
LNLLARGERVEAGKAERENRGGAAGATRRDLFLLSRQLVLFLRVMMTMGWVVWTGQSGICSRP